MIGQIQLDRPVLVVDDTNSTRYSTVRFLRAAGVDVIEATTGERGLALAPSCGAIVLDVNLPDIDGFEVCRRLRAGAVNPRVPAIHLSAQRMGDEDKIRGLESGADAYLTHPVDPGVLIATINALLRARAAEHSEQLSRARFEAVFRTAPVGIALVSGGGDLLELNDEMLHIVGAGAGSTSASRVDRVIHQVMRACDARGAGEGDAPTFVTPSDVQEPLHLNCRMTRLDNDTRLLVVVDVTVQHRLQVEREALLKRERAAREDAEDASRAKDSFLALLSHELRNPLAPISSAASLLQMAGSDHAVVERASGVISRQVGHMRELIDDLMDVSRVTRGLVELADEPLALADVVQAAVEQVRPLMDARRHRLAVDVGDAPVVVSGDRTRLIQVVANLLNNAAKYTPPGGEVGVRLSAADGRASITVSDTGVGMSAGLLPQVFDLFTQAERTPDRAQGGLGVGLALVRSVVQLHGGQVEARSAGEGEGSTFVVTLPLSQGRPAEAVATVAAPVDETRLDVLVVDDNEDAAATLADVLRLMGHRVSVSNDAPAALDRVLAGGSAHDVYILDIGLPGMTGYELAARIREHVPAAHSLFVALTGYGQPADRLQSQSAGFDQHLVKPVEESRLVEVLALASERRKQRTA